MNMAVAKAQIRTEKTLPPGNSIGRELVAFAIMPVPIIEANQFGVMFAKYSALIFIPLFSVRGLLGR